jgi:hypothetical protein
MRVAQAGASVAGLPPITTMEPYQPPVVVRAHTRQSTQRKTLNKELIKMGRGILLWLLGVPIPIIILLALIWH